MHCILHECVAYVVQCDSLDSSSLVLFSWKVIATEIHFFKAENLTYVVAFGTMPLITKLGEFSEPHCIPEAYVFEEVAYNF